MKHLFMEFQNPETSSPLLAKQTLHKKQVTPSSSANAAILSVCITTGVSAQYTDHGECLKIQPNHGLAQ